MFYSDPLQALAFTGIFKEKFKTWMQSYHLLVALSAPVSVKLGRKGFVIFFISVSLFLSHSPKSL